jgi:hypothetical protein
MPEPGRRDGGAIFEIALARWISDQAQTNLPGRIRAPRTGLRDAGRLHQHRCSIDTSVLVDKDAFFVLPSE